MTYWVSWAFLTLAVTSESLRSVAGATAAQPFRLLDALSRWLLG